VTSYKIGLQNTEGDEYRISLEIIGDDAIVGALEWDLGLVNYIEMIRHALTEKLRRTLGDRSKFNLGTFQLPKRNHGRSIVKDLFPEQIRFAYVHDPRGNSVLAALGSSDINHVPPQNALHWNTYELLPAGDLAMTVSGEKFMESMKPAIAIHLNIPTAALVHDGCSADGHSSLALRNRINDFHGTIDLKGMEMTMYGQNELELKVNMWDTTTPGMSVDIYVTVRVELIYNHETKQFDVTKTYQHHSTVHHRELWVVILEIITLGIGRLVTMIIEIIANGEINRGMRNVLNFDPAHGGLPTNIGGVMGEVVDRMQVYTPRWNRGNFLFPFNINW